MLARIIEGRLAHVDLGPPGVIPTTDGPILNHSFILCKLFLKLRSTDLTTLIETNIAHISTSQNL
jgi:hypothetical protein